MCNDREVCFLQKTDSKPIEVNTLKGQVIKLYISINDDWLYFDNTIYNYKHLKYLIDFDGGSTETDITLEDYSQLGFLKNKGKIPERLVRNVLLLFPSKDELCFNRYMANYIGLNPNINFDESKSYGLIKNIIKENI